jgi:hypothetical protein
VISGGSTKLSRSKTTYRVLFSVYEPSRRSSITLEATMLTFSTARWTTACSATDAWP